MFKLFAMLRLYNSKTRRGHFPLLHACFMNENYVRSREHSIILLGKACEFQKLGSISHVFLRPLVAFHCLTLLCSTVAPRSWTIPNYFVIYLTVWMLVGSHHVVYYGIMLFSVFDMKKKLLLSASDSSCL